MLSLFENHGNSTQKVHRFLRRWNAAGEYEAIIGSSNAAFKRTPEAIDTILAYDTKSIHLTVGDQNQIKSITVFRPEHVEFECVQRLGKDIASVEADLAQSAFRFTKVDAGLWCAQSGVLIIESDGIVDGVEVMAAQ